MVVEQIDNVAGATLKGRITASYFDLLNHLGEPMTNGLDGSTVEWRLEIEDDWGDIHRVVVYDRLEESTPTGEYDWCVAAKTLDGFDALFDYIQQCQAIDNWSKE